MAAKASSNPPQHSIHKNRLQEYTQRSALPLPSYFSANKGSGHEPKFCATVVVNGVPYKSSRAFSHRKEAEQDAAKVAYESILKKIKEEGFPHVQMDTTFCKSILYEFAVKMNLQRPVHTTFLSEGLLPGFMSTLVFNGKTYTGSVGRNKKEAEQLAARTVIQHLLGTGYGRLLSEIINSKHKLYAALYRVEETRMVSPVTFPEASGQVINVTAKTLPMPELKKPKFEPQGETSASLTGNITQVSDRSLSCCQVEVIGSQSSDVGTTAVRKRPRKKSKKEQTISQNNEWPSRSTAR